MIYYKIILDSLKRLLNFPRVLEFLKFYLSFIKNHHKDRTYFFSLRGLFRKANVEFLKHIPQLRGLYSHVRPDWTLDQNMVSQYDSVLTDERKGGDLDKQNTYLIRTGSEFRLYRVGDVFSEKRWFRIPFFFSKFNNFKKKSRSNQNVGPFFRKNYLRGEEAVNFLVGSSFIQLHSLTNTLAMTHISGDDSVFVNKDDFVFFPFFTIKKLDVWFFFLIFFYGIFEISLLFFFVKLWYGSIFDFFFFLVNNFFVISPYALLSTNTNTLYMLCFTLLLFMFLVSLITWLFPEDDEENYAGHSYEIEDSDVVIYPPTISAIGDFLYAVFYVLPISILWVFFVSKILAFIVIVFNVFLIPLTFLPLVLLGKLYNKIYSYWYTTPPHRFKNKPLLRKSMKNTQSMFYWNMKLHRDNYFNNLFLKRNTDRFLNKTISQINVGDNNIKQHLLRLNRKNLYFWSYPNNIKKNKRNLMKMLQWINNNPFLFLDEKQKQYFPRKKTYKIINPLLERFWLYTLLKDRASDEDIYDLRYEEFLDDKELSKYENFHFIKEDALDNWFRKYHGLRALKLMHGFFEQSEFRFHPIWRALRPFEFFSPGSRVNPADFLENDFRQTRKFSHKRINSLGRTRIHFGKQFPDEFPSWKSRTAFQISTLYPQSLNYTTLNYNKRLFDLFLKGWHHKILKAFGHTWYSDVTEYPDYYRYFFLKMPDKPYLGTNRVTHLGKKARGRRVRRIVGLKQIKLVCSNFASFLKRTNKLSRSARRVFGEYYFRSFLKKNVSHGVFSKNYFDRNFLFNDFLIQRNSQILDRLLEKTVSPFFSDMESRNENVIFFPNLRLRQKLINKNKLSRPFIQHSVYDSFEKFFMAAFYPFDNLNRRYFDEARNKIIKGKYHIRRYTEGIFEGQEIGTPLYRRHFISKYRMDLLKFIMQRFRSLEWELLTYDKTNKDILSAFLNNRLAVVNYKQKIRERLRSTFYDNPLFYIEPFEEDFITEASVEELKEAIRETYGDSESTEELIDNLYNSGDFQEFLGEEEDEDEDEDKEDAFFAKRNRFYLPYLRLLYLKREQNKVWSFFSKYQNDFLTNLVKTTGNPLIRSKYALNTFLTLHPFFVLNKKDDSLALYKSFWHNYRNLRKYEAFFLEIWKERLERKKYFNLQKIYNKKTLYPGMFINEMDPRLSFMDFFELEKSQGITKFLSSDKKKLQSHNTRFYFRKNLEFENQFLDEEGNGKNEMFADLFTEYQYLLEYLKDKYVKKNDEVSFFLKNDFAAFSKYLLFLKLYELYKARLMQKWFFFDTGSILSNLHKNNMHFQGYSRFSHFYARQKKRLTLLFSHYLQWKKWRFFEKAKLQRKILQIEREIDSFEMSNLTSGIAKKSYYIFLNKKRRKSLKRNVGALKRFFPDTGKKSHVFFHNLLNYYNESILANLALSREILAKNGKDRTKVLKNLVDSSEKKLILLDSFMEILKSNHNKDDIKNIINKDFMAYNPHEPFRYKSNFFLNIEELKDAPFVPYKALNVHKNDVYENYDGLMFGKKFVNLNYKQNLLNMFFNLNPDINNYASFKRLKLSFVPYRSPMFAYTDPYYFYRKLFFRKYLKPVDKFFSNQFLFSDRYFAQNDQSSTFYNRKSFLNKRFLYSKNNYFGFIFPKNIPLFNELEIKKKFFFQINRVLLQSIYFLLYNSTLNEKNDEFDITYFYYNIYNLLLRKYVNFIFVNQQTPSRKDKRKNIMRLKNLFLLLRLRYIKYSPKVTVNGKIPLEPPRITDWGAILRGEKLEVEPRFEVNYYPSIQKISIPFGRFVFWLLRNEKINTALIQYIKNDRFNKINKHFFLVNYPTLFVDRIIKRKKPFFFYAKNDAYKDTHPNKLWKFLVKDSIFPLSFLSNTVRKRLIVYKKQRKLYKQFVLPHILNLASFKHFFTDKKRPFMLEVFPRRTFGFLYSKRKREDLFMIRHNQLTRPNFSSVFLDETLLKYFFDRKFLHSFLNASSVHKQGNKHTLGEVFFRYAQYPNYRAQFFFRSLIINTYILRLLDINNSIFNLFLMDKKSNFFPYKEFSLTRDYPYYTKYFHFLNHIFPYRRDYPYYTKYFHFLNRIFPFKLTFGGDELSEEIFVNKMSSANDLIENIKKEKFLRRKLQYLRRYFLTNVHPSINVCEFDKYVFLRKFKKLRKLRKFAYIFNNLLELPLKKTSLGALQDFFFDWNYSYFDLISSKRKERLNLIKKYFLNTYPGIRLPVSSFSNKRNRDLFKLKNNIFLNSIKSPYGVEAYPRYSSYNIRNKIYDSALKKRNKVLLYKSYINDPYKIQRYLKLYNLVGKRFNKKRRENIHYVYQSFWKLQLQNLLQHFSLHYDTNQIDPFLFVNDWNKYMFKNKLVNSKTTSASGNFFVQPREYAALFFFLNPSFNKTFLPVYDKFLKNKNFLNLRSDFFFKASIYKKKMKLWRLLHTKFKYTSYLNFLLWIKRKYGMKFIEDFKKNNFLWKDSFDIYPKPTFRSLFQRAHRVRYKSFIDKKLKLHVGTEESEMRKTKSSFVFLKPGAAFSNGKIRIPADKVRPKFFSFRQSILRKLRKAVFAFKASTGFLYFNYKIKEWNDRLVPHVRMGDKSRFLDIELEETIISRTNDLFLPAYKNFKLPNIPFLENYSAVINKISDISLNFSDSFIDGLVLRLHSFWNRTFFSDNEYVQKNNTYFSNLIIRQEEDPLFFSKKNYTFYNTELFLGENINSNDEKAISINSFLESDFFLAEQFRMLAYEEILKYSKQYETLVLTRKYQHFTDLHSVLEKNIFFQTKANDCLKMQLESFYELEPFFSSVYYGLELQDSIKTEIVQRKFFDHFFNLVKAEGDLSLFLKTNLFNHFNRWFFLDRQFSFDFFKSIHFFFNKRIFFDDSMLLNALNSSFSNQYYGSLINNSSGFFVVYIEHFFLKLFYIFLYLFRDSTFISFLKYIFDFSWIYSSNFFFFLINFGVYFFFFFLYFLFVVFYFFWLKKSRFQKKSPFFFSNFSEQLKSIPFGWDWQILKGGGGLRTISKLSGFKRPTKELFELGFKDDNVIVSTFFVNGWMQNDLFNESGFFDDGDLLDSIDESLFEKGNTLEYDFLSNEKLSIFYKMLSQNEDKNCEIKLRNFSLNNNSKNKFKGFAKTLYNGKILSYKLKFFHSTFNAKPSRKSVLFNPNLNLFGRNLFILETLRKEFFFRNFLKNSEFSLVRNKKNMWTQWFPFVNKNHSLSFQQHMFIDKLFGGYFNNLLQLNFEKFTKYLKEKKALDFLTRKQKIGLLKYGKVGKIDRFKRTLPIYIRKTFNYRTTGNAFYFLYKKRFGFYSKIRKKFYYNLYYKDKFFSSSNYLFLSKKWKSFIKLSKVQRFKRLSLRKKYFLNLIFISEKRNFNLNPYFHFFRFFPFFFKNKFLDVFSFDSLDHEPSLASPEYDAFISPSYNRSFFSFRETLLDKQNYSWGWSDKLLVATVFYFKFLIIVFLSFVAILCFLKFFVPFFIFIKFWIKFFI